MRNQRARLGSDLAALNAETAIDTMWAITVRAGKNRDRAPDGDRNIQRGAAFDQRVTNPAHRMRTVSIAVRMAPGIIRRPGNGHLQFELLVVGLDVCVGDGPVSAHAIARIDLEVGGMQPGSERRPVDRATANALAAVIGAQRQRISSPGDARLSPVELVGAGLIADPVALRIPEWPRFQAHDVEACAGQPLQQHAAGRADADDHVVDLLIVSETPHRQVNRLQRTDHVLVADCEPFKSAQEWLLQCVPPLP